MSRKLCVSRPGLTAQVKGILLLAKKRWQTASLVGCQMVVAPDASYREAAQKGFKKPCTAGCSASLGLIVLWRQNIVERRRNKETNRFEYRILKQK